MSKFRRKSKHNKVKYSEAERQFFKDWDEYFGEYNKREAGTRWARNNEFDLLDTSTRIEQRLYLLNWFKDLIRNLKTQSCWVLECGIFYVIDKTTMKAYYFEPHVSITRRVRTINPKIWGDRVKQLLKDELDENIAWSRGGHASYFHAGNIFFLNQLGFTIEELTIAPGWWTNCGVSRQIRILQKEDVPLIDIDNVNEVLTPINEYREKELTRIAERVVLIMEGKFPGEKIYDALLYTDSEGIRWNEQ